MEIPAVVQKYWPWGLGAVVGLVIITKIRGGNSSGGGVVYMNAGPSDAQIAAQLQMATIAAQNDQQNRVLDMQSAYQTAQLELERAALDSQNQANVAAAGVATLQTQLGYQAAAQQNAGALVQAQGTAAAGVGSAVQAMLGGLFSPIISAINSAGSENEAALTAAAITAGQSYQAQANIVAAGQQTVQAYTEVAKQGLASLGGAATFDMVASKNPFQGYFKNGMAA